MTSSLCGALEKKWFLSISREVPKGPGVLRLWETPPRVALERREISGAAETSGGVFHSLH
jgi:hypothetical protein